MTAASGAQGLRDYDEQSPLLSLSGHVLGLRNPDISAAEVSEILVSAASPSPFELVQNRDYFSPIIKRF